MIASEAAHDARASQPKRTAANSGFSHASCGAKLVVGKMSCFALKRDGIRPMAASASPAAIPANHGYGPSQLQSAYNLTSASAADGAGQTVAIVDFYDDPNAASDLAAYRAAAGLPPVPSFEQVNQEGQTSPLPAEAPTDDDWTLEESADLDMVSAICPECNIVLVEADNDYSDGGDIAQNTAAGLAGYISDSWGSAETSDDTTADSAYFDHPGVVTTVAGGDGDYGQISYPATSPNVVSVGGTTLSAASNARGWIESVWSHDGAGCSAYLCTAETGYDAPTGIGSPDGIAGLVSGGGAGVTSTTNLALNQPATASSSYQTTYAASNVTDGSTSTYWESTDNALPQWLQVDLGSSTTVGRIVLDLPPTWTTRTQTITIQGSADGTNYTTLAPSAGYTFNPSTGNTVTVTFSAASVRYVKLTFTANTGWPAGQLSELQVYAS